MTQLNLSAVALGAARECERQQVGEFAMIGLLEAHLYAITQYEDGHRLPAQIDILRMGGLIEPEAGSEYRTTPVTFRDGGSAVAASMIESALAQYFKVLDTDTSAHDFTKAFLQVHPFRDGNGRTAWLLYNWLLGTLAEPIRLPDFYAEWLPSVADIEPMVSS